MVFSKSRTWVKKRYFRSIKNRNWSFFATREATKGESDLVDLYYADDTKIVRHVKIRNMANPYSDDWQGDIYCQAIARLGERECGISITGPHIFPKMEISQPLRLMDP